MIQIPILDGALCASIEPDLWFPEKGGNATLPKQLCGHCDVRAECLQWAIDHGPVEGIWGGLSENDRKKLKGGAA